MALSNSGARPILDLADDLGRTPLVVACQEGRTEAVGALLGLGANPNSAAQPLGLTPCHYAALFGHFECLRLLIQHNASPSVDTTPLNSFRMRPTHLAAANGWLQCVKEVCNADFEADGRATHFILLNKDGIGVDLIERQTLGAEEIAFSQGHHDIVQFLRNRRAQLNRLNEVDLEPETTSVFRRLAERHSERRLDVVDLGTPEGAPTSPATGNTA